MTLHDQILAKLAELRATAEAASGADVRLSMDWPRTPAKDALIRHFASFDPAHSLRWIEWAEDVAKRHAPWFDELDLRVWCEGHADLIPQDRCEEIRGLARALGLPDQHEGSGKA